MKMWIRVLFAGAAALLIGVGTGQELLASRTLSPPRLLKNKKLSPFELGRLIYFTDEYVGRDGKNCAACHESKLPLRRDSLAKRKNELSKQIQWCLATRVKNEEIEPGTPEFAGIMEYVYATHGLHAVVDEDPKIERLMSLGTELFADGDFDGAKTYLERALPSLKSKYHVAQSHVILGIIYHVLAEPDMAKDHFQKAVDADPTIDVNPSLFSPKTVELFYSVKRKMLAEPGEEER